MIYFQPSVTEAGSEEPYFAAEEVNIVTITMMV